MSQANKVIRYLLTTFQLLCLAGAVTLNNLSYKKAGVNHHVLYKKKQYMQTLLDLDHRIIYGLILGILLTGMLVYLIRYKHSKNLSPLLPMILITIISLLFLVMPAAQALPAYIYILFLLMITWVLELIKFLIKINQK